MKRVNSWYSLVSMLRVEGQGCSEALDASRFSLITGDFDTCSRGIDSTVVGVSDMVM